MQCRKRTRGAPESLRASGEDFRETWSGLNVQQQVLALPGADHLQEYLVLGLLDDRERRDELIAKQLHQGLAFLEFAQRFVQRARQAERKIVRAASDRIARLQAFDHAQVAAGK